MSCVWCGEPGRQLHYVCQRPGRQKVDILLCKACEKFYRSCWIDGVDLSGIPDWIISRVGYLGSLGGDHVNQHQADGERSVREG